MILSVILGTAAILVLAVLFYYFGVTAGLKLDRSKLTLDTSCMQIYDGEGNQIDTSAKRSATPFSSFPDYLPNAFVAVEDKRFYTHNGLDYRRIGKALMKNIASFSFREGASTISQQLIKNTHLTSEKTVNRKLKELKLTRILEHNYEKEEILELYLNSIYFGHSAFGISDAAYFYFGKDPSELTAAESAMLAALVKSPNRYSPFRNTEKCLERRNLVLSLMKEQGYLSESEYRDALAESLPDSPAETRSGNAYLDLIYEELSELFPDVKSGELGSLRIETFFEPDLQRELEKTEAESDICILVRDNRSQGIKALYSTVGTPKRLPASTIKPLLVYAPALEENLISPATPVLDERTDFGGYSPDDYNGASGQYMSVRYAISRSVNIPAVKILNELGIRRGANYLGKMDLPIEEEDLSLALALGGMREGFTLPQLCDAYSTFANSGMFSPSRAISRIVNEHGTELYKFCPQTRRVFSEDVAYLMNDMLMTTVREGTAKKLKSLPFPICAKTGTGGNAEGNTDAYTVSYTTENVVAVWLGNRDNSPIEATGGGLPANIALRINRYLYRNGAPKAFPECGEVETLSFDKEEYEKNHRILRSDPAAPLYTDNRELFRKSALPKEQSNRYSAPSISQPRIYVKNNAVYIELCQTEYYDYEIKRENRGKIATIYNGKYQKTICDNSVRSGESYSYTVVPRYKENIGQAVTLPLVKIEKTEELPDRWWE